MPTITIQAHFDGERIVLDEQFDLPTNAPLMVTILPNPTQESIESEGAWLRAVAASDAFASLADPAEDIYSAEDGEPLDHAL